MQSVNDILIPFSEQYTVGSFLRRQKRFSVAVQFNNQETWVHSNNSGSMLGLLRQGLPVLLSKSDNPKRKLAFTQECVWIAKNLNKGITEDKNIEDPKYYDNAQGFWVGVNTSIPNKIIELAFKANLLDFTKGYTHIKREVKRATSRLDACCTAIDKVPLWIECKNVTLVEEEMAYFPDAITERGQKHLRELMDIVKHGERAAMFYLIQRQDAKCFAPADFIDSAYAELFWQAVDMGVEVYPYTANICSAGISLGHILKLAR